MLIKDKDYPQKGPTLLQKDNLSCMKFIENERASARIQHLEVKKWYVKDNILKNEM